MKILLFGSNGQVGFRLKDELLSLGEVYSTTRQEVDFEKPDTIQKIIHQYSPDVIVNAVAYTNVDGAEFEQDKAYAINAHAVKVIADEAEKIKALVVHYSTDYVFDGEKGMPYFEDDTPNPLNIYGKTKLLGEQFLQKSNTPFLIFRTSGVYDNRGHNFVLTMKRLFEERTELNVINDQYSSLTSAPLISKTTVQILKQLSENGEFNIQTAFYKKGIYHLTSKGSVSWYDFSIFLLKAFKKDTTVTINSISSDQYPQTALRPKKPELSIEKIQTEFKIILPDWDKSFRLVF